MKDSLRRFLLAALLLAAFVLWTIVVCHVDVQPIGPAQSCVGLATLNGRFHSLTGMSMPLYTLTDWLGLIPVGIALAFALLGLTQWIRRKHILRVDRSILILGGFYLLVIAVHLFFEAFVVNKRPVLIGGRLEASYPSSTTLLTLCVLPTAVQQLHTRIRQTGLRRWIIGILSAFAAFMVVGRLLSGVHWLSDIIGGALLSTGLVMLYRAACQALPDGPTL